MLAGIAAAGWLLLSSPLMEVKKVTVEGAANLDPAALAAASASRARTSSWQIRARQRHVSLRQQ